MVICNCTTVHGYMDVKYMAEFIGVFLYLGISKLRPLIRHVNIVEHGLMGVFGGGWGGGGGDASDG